MCISLHCLKNCAMVMWKCCATWHRALMLDQVHLANLLDCIAFNEYRLKWPPCSWNLYKWTLKWWLFSANYRLGCRAPVRPSEMFPSHPECFVFPWEWIQRVGKLCFQHLFSAAYLFSNLGGLWERLDQSLCSSLVMLVMVTSEASLTVLSSLPHIPVN